MESLKGGAMIIKTKNIKVDTAGLSLRVAQGRLQLSLEGHRMGEEAVARS